MLSDRVKRVALSGKPAKVRECMSDVGYIDFFLSWVKDVKESS
jgi:hypothetical protein